MRKNILIASLCIAVCFSIAAIATVFAGEKSRNDLNVIKDKDMAISVGKIILEEHFPELFSDKEVSVDATFENGVWKIHNVIERVKHLDDGTFVVTTGGECFVKIDADTCEVIELGVND